MKALALLRRGAGRGLSRARERRELRPLASSRAGCRRRRSRSRSACRWTPRASPPQAVYDPPPPRSPRSSTRGATSRCCARAIRSSTARSCISSRGSPSASRSRSCPACRRWARAPPPRGWPLAARDDVLAVHARALLDDDELAARLAACRGCRHHQARPPFRPRARVLTRLGLAAARHYVERASLAERARAAARRGRRPRRVPYFSMILVHRRGEAGDERELPAAPRSSCWGRARCRSRGGSPALLPGARLHAPAARGIAADTQFAEAVPHIARALRRRHADRRAVRRRHTDPRRGAAARRQDAPSRRWSRWPRTARRSCRCSAGIAAPTRLARSHRRAHRRARRDHHRERCSRSASRSTSRRRAGASPIPRARRRSTAALLAGETRRARRSRPATADWLIGGIAFLAAARRARSASPTARRRRTSARWSCIRRCWRWASAACAAAPRPSSKRSSTRPSRQRGLAAGAVALVASHRPQDRRAGDPVARARARTCRRGSLRRPRCAPRRRGSPHPSDAVFRAVGCYGVAEGAALAAAGADGALVVAKTRLAPTPPAPSPARRARSTRSASAGRAAGSRSSASAPATQDWRTAEAERGARRGQRRRRATSSISICSGRRSPARRATTARSAPRTARARLALDLGGAGQQRRAGLVGRCRDLRPRGAGLRADRPRGARGLAADRSRGGARRLGAAGRGGAARRAARP